MPPVKSPIMNRTLQSAIRLVYDAIMLNAAMVCAIYFHYLTFLFREYHGFTFTVEFYLRHTAREMEQWYQYAPIVTVCALLIFSLCGFYRLHRYRGISERVSRIAVGVLLAVGTLPLIMYFHIDRDPFPRGAALIYAGLLFVVLGFPRILFPLLRAFGDMLQPEDTDTRAVKKVLVIGGAGYIGSVLCRQLLKQGYRVCVLDLALFGEESLAEVKKSSAFELYQGDFRNIGEIYSALDGVDAVVHLGGLVGDPACAVREDLTIDINYAATRVLIDLCKAAGVRRFVFASTCSVYGASDTVLNEESPLRPVSLYARTKIDSERMIRESASPGFAPVILRFATVFGASPRPRFDLVVNTFVANAIKKGELHVFGGSQWRPFVHVSDVARAIERSLRHEAAAVSGQTFNVGDDRMNFTIAEIAQIVAEAIPGTTIHEHASRGDVRNYRVSFRKINETLSFEAAVDLVTGIRELIASIHDQTEIDTMSQVYNNYLQAKVMIEEAGVVTQNRLHNAFALSSDWQSQPLSTKVEVTAD